MVTLLLLHLARVADSDALVPYGRSGRYWGEADLLARDPLGRIHLFECKPATFSADDADQLSAYALATLFVNSEAHLNYRLSRRPGDVLGMQLAKYMAATLTNVSDYTLRRETVRKYAAPFEGRAHEASLDPTTWNAYWAGIKESERDPLRLRALRNRAVSKGWPESSVPGVHDYERLSQRWSSALVEPPEPLFDPERPAVLWMVAPSFGPGVVERLKRWRAEQVDVRMLEFEARVNTHEGRVMVRVRQEAFPRRDRILQAVNAWGAAHSREERFGFPMPHGAPRQLRLRFYHKRRASDRKSEALHGLPLPDPDVRAELVDWRDNSVVIASLRD